MKNPGNKLFVAVSLLWEPTVPNKSLTNSTFIRSISVEISGPIWLSSTQSRRSCSDFTKKLLESQLISPTPRDPVGFGVRLHFLFNSLTLPKRNHVFLNSYRKPKIVFHPPFFRGYVKLPGFNRSMMKIFQLLRLFHVFLLKQVHVAWKIHKYISQSQNPRIETKCSLICLWHVGNC